MKISVFRAFACRCLGDYYYYYHDLHVKSDVPLRADVFENFREISLNYYCGHTNSKLH